MVFVLALCFWVLCFSRSPWNHIISVHYEPEAYYSIGFYCRIHTASKYLHNDLARAIRRWKEKNQGTVLTYFLLRSLANPNVVPRLEMPTTMLELAVELGSSRIVGCLLEARASVAPIEGALPPLLLAVLHRHEANVQLLLRALASPWEMVPIGHLHRYSLQCYARAARNEAFSIVQAAAAQEPRNAVLTLLLQEVPCPPEPDDSPPDKAITRATVLSEFATTILRQVVWTFQHVIKRQEGKPDFTTLRWRVILQGIALPAFMRMPIAAVPQDYDDDIPWDLLSEVD